MTVALRKDPVKTSPLSWLGSFFDFIYPLLLFAICLGTFTRFGLDSFGWLAIYGVTAYQVINNFQLFIKSAISSWLIFVVPVLTLVSTFWSASPGHTFIVSIQFIYTTVIGVWLGAAYSPYRIFLGLCIAAGVGVIASSFNAYLQIIPAFSEADGFFIGIYNHKNTMGRILVLLGISLFLVGIKLKHVWVATILAILLLIPMVAAESATSLVMLLLVFSIPAIWLIVTSKGSVRLTVILGVIGATLLMIAYLSVVDIDLVKKLLGELGKDSTLTGRTFIWSVGWRIFEWKPILGVGFDAFWNAGTFDDVRAIYLAYGEGINGFHNAFIEVLVSLGLVGETAFIITMLVVLYKVLAWFFVSRSIGSLCALYMILVIVITSFLEVVGFRGHDVNHIMFVAMYVLSLDYYKNRNNLEVKVLRTE